MPPRRCARRRGDRCSPAATRKATGWSDWPITAGNTAPESGPFRRCCPNRVGTQHFSVCSTRRPTRNDWASTSSTCRTPTASTWWTRRRSGCATSAPHARGQPFLLTAGFFETHRPYPRDRYEPADSAAVDLPDYLPDTPEVRDDLADFYGVHHHRRRRGRPAAGHAGRDRTGRQHLGGVLHRSRPGVPPREIHAVRRRNRHRDADPPAHQPGGAARASTTNCSAASTWSRRCWSCWASTCRPTSRACRTRTRCSRRNASRSGARSRVHR